MSGMEVSLWISNEQAMSEKSGVGQIYCSFPILKSCILIFAFGEVLNVYIAVGYMPIEIIYKNAL
jgi:hypothetical protein